MRRRTSTTMSSLWSSLWSSDDDNVGPWQHPCFPSYAQSDTSCLVSECWYTDVGWATYNVVHSIQFTSPKVETPKESWYTLYRRWMGYIASLHITSPTVETSKECWCTYRRWKGYIASQFAKFASYKVKTPKECYIRFRPGIRTATAPRM